MNDVTTPQGDALEDRVKTLEATVAELLMAVGHLLDEADRQRTPEENSRDFRQRVASRRRALGGV